MLNDVFVVSWLWLGNAYEPEIALTKTPRKPEFELLISFNMHLKARALTEDLEGFFSPL